MNDTNARDTPPPRPDYGRRGHADGEWLPPAEPARPRSLADELEPGALRDELGTTPVSAPPDPQRLAPLRFTGDGAEYFRIWIVNLLLTVVTLGIYSAWAKVRKTRYFWQNTRLEGQAFDYHGDPRAILLGRVVALVLLGGYTFAFDLSRNAGLVMVAVLCLVGPWLFMRAQRFKLANTSWRGLRFGFDAHAREAYSVVLPPLVLWLSGSVVGAVASERMGLLVAASVLSVVMVPWMHHRLKAYQHRRARYGEREFSFIAATRGFYATYFKAGLLAMLGSFAGMLAFFAITALVARGGVSGDTLERAVTSMIFGTVVAIVLGILGWVLAWPYFAARMQAIVWSHTRLGDVRFSTAIAAIPLMRLVAKNVLLTVVSAGLYWPFAAVALARYRVECMRTESDEPLTSLAMRTSSQPGFAAGDAAIDAFGLDIGL